MHYFLMFLGVLLVAWFILGLLAWGLDRFYPIGGPFRVFDIWKWLPVVFLIGICDEIAKLLRRRPRGASTLVTLVFILGLAIVCATWFVAGWRSGYVKGLGVRGALINNGCSVVCPSVPPSQISTRL